MESRRGAPRTYAARAITLDVGHWDEERGRKQAEVNAAVAAQSSVNSINLCPV